MSGGEVSRRRRGQVLARRLLTIGAAIVLTLVVADRVIATLHGPFLKDENSVGLSLDLTEAGTHLRPGAVGHFRTSEFSMSMSVNSLGLRGPEVTLSKPPAVKRVLALGDSFTGGWGVGYEEAWPARLQAALGAGAEVVNSGWAGLSPSGYLRYLRNEGAALEADIVLIALFVGNDVVDEVVRLNAGPRPIDRIEYGARYIGTSARLGVTGRVKDLIEWGLPSLYDLATLALAKVRSPIERGGPFRYILANQQPAELEEAWASTLNALGETAELVASRGQRFGVVVIPFYEQVAFDLVEPGFTSTGPQRRIDVYCEERALDCLDLLPAFRAVGAPELLYYARDGHWTPAGHSFAAEHVAAWLRD